MEATLYVILGSHACRTGMLLLEHKGIPYRTVTLPTGLHPTAVRVLGFGREASTRHFDGGTNPLLASADRLGTVPALRIDGQKVQSNRAIARFLDELQPDPPLFPAEPEQRAEVEDAEAWGDDELQMAARRLALAAACAGSRAGVDGAGSGRLGPILWRNATLRRAGMRMISRVFDADDPEVEQRLVAELPPMLDRIDAWIEAGVLNGEKLNAADLMIAPSLALLSYRPDTRADIERRPALRLVDRLLPDPGVQQAA